MKIAISVPDHAFARIDAAARAAGMNRSQFFTEAALRLAEEHDEASFVARYNAVLGSAGVDDEDDEDVEAVTAYARRTLASESW